jgi:hypothetical protein
MAEREPPKTLDTMIRRGIAGKLFDLDELARAIGNCRGRKGTAKLRKVLESWIPATLRSRSDLETEVPEACREVGVPPPLINDMRCGYEVDFQWKGSSILLESDGHPYHLSRADRHRDYQKMLDLTAAGNIVVRIDEKMIFENRMEFGMKLRKLLEDEGVVELQPLPPQPVAVSDRAPP